MQRPVLALLGALTLFLVGGALCYSSAVGRLPPVAPQALGRRRVLAAGTGAAAAWPVEATRAAGMAQAARHQDEGQDEDEGAEAAGEGPEDLVAGPAYSRGICARCCGRDWCECASLSLPDLGEDGCDCLAHFKALGFEVPLDMPSAFALSGKKTWATALRWRAASFPRWAPVAERDVVVANSTFPGAGNGLFANSALPQWAVLPPYQGTVLTFRELQGERRKKTMNYVWCPFNKIELTTAPLEGKIEQDLHYNDPSFCVDARNRIQPGTSTVPSGRPNATRSMLSIVRSAR